MFQTGCTEERDESILRQVQWSNLREIGETWHYDTTHKSFQHCSSPCWA